MRDELAWLSLLCQTSFEERTDETHQQLRGEANFSVSRYVVGPASLEPTAAFRRVNVYVRFIASVVFPLRSYYSTICRTQSVPLLRLDPSN